MANSVVVRYGGSRRALAGGGPGCIDQSSMSMGAFRRTTAVDVAILRGSYGGEESNGEGIRRVEVHTIFFR